MRALQGRRRAVALTRNEFVLLREFVHHPGRVLNRDYLLDALAGKRADPYDRSIDVLVGRLRRKIEPDAKQPTLIVTVAGEGYKFAMPVGGAAARSAAALSVSALLPDKARPPRLSIVVLPLANMSGDPEQDYFVDGVTESLTTDLSRMRSCLVIGRNTAFTYKGKAVDLKTIGRELNVRYVLEGSVQRARDQMRVSVQLIDAESGNHLWAERFDKTLGDLFRMQDEIVARLANKLGAEIASAEARRSRSAPNPDSFDLVCQGWACSYKGPTLENLSQARAFFERALALDPKNVEALVQTAMVDFHFAEYLFSEDRASRLAGAEAALLEAIRLAPEHAGAHFALGPVLCVTGRAWEGIAACERALAIDQNLAGAHGAIGAFKAHVGRAEETEAHVREALRLSPRDSAAFHWLMLSAAPTSSLADMRKRSCGWNDPSRRTATTLCVIFISPEPLRVSGGWRRPKLPPGPGWRSIPNSPSRDFAPHRRATMPTRLPAMSSSPRHCARLGCRRHKRGPS